MTGAAALQQPWRHGAHVDARGATLDDPLVLDGQRLCGVDLSGAVLRGGLSARGAEFQGLAWRHGAEIGGACDLTGARFRIDLRAAGLRCAALALDGAEVRGVLDLARLCAGQVRLRQTLVLANLTLEAAQIAGPLDLSGAEILGGLWADGLSAQSIATAGAAVFGRQRLSRTSG